MLLVFSLVLQLATLHALSQSSAAHALRNMIAKMGRGRDGRERRGEEKRRTAILKRSCRYVCEIRVRNGVEHLNAKGVA